jgi:hypothetical protein
MSSLRADMSSGNWICPARHVFTLRKSRSRTKTINLGPDKFMTCKQDTIELIEIGRITSCNLIIRNHT